MILALVIVLWLAAVAFVGAVILRAAETPMWRQYRALQRTQSELLRLWRRKLRAVERGDQAGHDQADLEMRRCLDRVQEAEDGLCLELSIQRRNVLPLRRRA